MGINRLIAEADRIAEQTGGSSSEILANLMLADLEFQADVQPRVMPGSDVDIDPTDAYYIGTSSPRDRGPLTLSGFTILESEDTDALQRQVEEAKRRRMPSGVKFEDLTDIRPGGIYAIGDAATPRTWAHEYRHQADPDLSEGEVRVVDALTARTPADRREAEHFIRDYLYRRGRPSSGQDAEEYLRSGAMDRLVRSLKNRAQSEVRDKVDSNILDLFDVGPQSKEYERRLQDIRVNTTPGYRSFASYAEGGTVSPDPLAGKATGQESSLSTWAGPYVTDMLGRGQALAQTPYEAYTGPLTAGTTGAQQAAFSGIANLAVPTEQMQAFTPGTFTDPGTAQQFMNPYLQAALEPQLAEARRQAEISRVNQAGRLTRAGAFGGGRQAVMESELNRNLLRNLADITGAGYNQAFQQGRQQFNTEEALRRAATEGTQRFGLEALAQQARLGGLERGINQEAIDAARRQFEEERLFPYRQIQFEQSLLQGLPLAAQNITYQQPGIINQLAGGAANLEGFFDTIADIFNRGGGGGGGATDESGATGG